MKTQFSLSELAATLEANAVKKEDFILSSKQLSLEPKENGKLVVTGTPRQNFDVVAEYDVSDTAHSQIATRLNIPSAYYSRMRSESPDLLAENVNHWILNTKAENRMLRVMDGKVRAYLSDRYHRIDNEQIAGVVFPEFAGVDGLKVTSSAITEHRMYIKAAFMGKQAEVRKGDIVTAGIAISNSEVGMGAVKVEPMVYRLVCENGLILPDRKFMARHLGGRITEFDALNGMLSDEAVRADDHAVLLKIRDIVRGTLSSVWFESQVSAMRDAAADRITGHPEEAVKMVTKRLSLTDFESGGVLRHLIDGGDLSRWGMLNAVTRTAHDVESYDRATELETAGSTILNLPRSQWQAIAEAA